MLTLLSSLLSFALSVTCESLAQLVDTADESRFNMQEANYCANGQEGDVQSHTSRMISLLSCQYDRTSYIAEGTSDTDRHGLGGSLTPRRHRWESLINSAMLEARNDWQRLIGPIETFADANPYHGNFVALVLPYTQPDRLKVSAYFMECK